MAEGDVKAKTEMDLAFEQAAKKKKEQGRAAIAEADTKAKLDTAEKRIKALERINKSLRPPGCARPRWRRYGDIARRFAAAWIRSGLWIIIPPRAG